MQASTSQSAIHPRRQHSKNISLQSLSSSDSDPIPYSVSQKTSTPRHEQDRLLTSSWRRVALVYVLLCSILFFVHAVNLFRLSSTLYSATHDESNLALYMPKILPRPSNSVLESFKPFILRGRSSNSIAESAVDISACLWAVEADLVHLTEWAKDWAGPVSIVLLTNFNPIRNGVEFNKLSRRLSSLRSNIFRSPIDRISIHLLYTPVPIFEQAHNAHLNLARLFAPTPFVVLFPLGLSDYPSNHMYQELLTSRSRSLAHPHIIPRTIKTQNETVSPPDSTLQQQPPLRDKSLPFKPDSALLVLRDDDQWCTERFFIPSPNEWAECLWQFWLSDPMAMRELRTGDGSIISWGKEEDQTPDSKLSPPSSSAVSIRIHRRMSLQFRSETCILTARQFVASGSWSTSELSKISTESREEWEKVQHVRKICNEALVPWAKYVLE